MVQSHTALTTTRTATHTLTRMMHTIKTFFFRFAPPVLWMALIFALSSQSVLPGPNVIWMDFVFKKSAHMFVYAVLYVLMFRATSWGKPKKEWVLPLILTIAYAMSDEIHQSLVPGRTATLRDIGYDGLGATVALLRMYRFI